MLSSQQSPLQRPDHAPVREALHCVGLPVDQENIGQVRSLHRVLVVRPLLVPFPGVRYGGDAPDKLSVALNADMRAQGKRGATFISERDGLLAVASADTRVGPAREAIAPGLARPKTQPLIPGEADYRGRAAHPKTRGKLPGLSAGLVPGFQSKSPQGESPAQERLVPKWGSVCQVDARSSSESDSTEACRIKRSAWVGKAPAQISTGVGTTDRAGCHRVRDGFSNGRSSIVAETASQRSIGANGPRSLREGYGADVPASSSGDLTRTPVEQVSALKLSACLSDAGSIPAGSTMRGRIGFDGNQDLGGAEREATAVSSANHKGRTHCSTPGYGCLKQLKSALRGERGNRIPAIQLPREIHEH